MSIASKCTEENYYVLLNAKHGRLNKALDRVDALLIKYKSDLVFLSSIGSNWDKANDWDFNLLYDLQDRIKDKLHENYILVGDWNWKVHGMNIIDVGN